MKRFITLFFALGMAAALSAQVIRMNFPHFAGKEYVFYLAQAGRTDTIQRGALDANGQTALIVPKTHSGYTGMSMFRLTDGGGLDIVLNKEKAFLIHCTEAQPNDENIIFTGSPENQFLRQNYRNQQAILDKYGVVRPALDVYTPKDSLYPLFERESKRLETAYSALQTETARSPLYAARIYEINRFLMGLGSGLIQTQEEREQEQFDFINKRLNMEQLYTSGFWNPTLDQWMAMQSERSDEKLLVEDAKALLSRVKKEERKEVYKDLLNKTILLFVRYGKDELLSQLGVDNLLEAGNRAPALIKENAKYTPANALVVFYESGCNNCENELVQLQGNYPLIKEKGYDIISVAADMDKEIFEKTSAVFPWPEKLCDYQGFDGVNFKSYGILGTPTIFVTDKEGNIVGRYARLVDTKLLE